ncbi:hypothetical protein K443DRAFT_681525 [Laccaria amethystina LaAM-08-1]|uniref:Uncharacterized protein n=1 Tax=Laccaria amethystina LaAM-08-1 TaxID=1095629 RepID=A0A0C9XN19_9AGAR|nr:hypothetical protein K443DRAFT_681525 [Laccaria amethystina LaAM-08-1]
MVQTNSITGLLSGYGLSSSFSLVFDRQLIPRNRYCAIFCTLGCWDVASASSRSGLSTSLTLNVTVFTPRMHA